MPNIEFTAEITPSSLPLAGLTFHWRLTINHKQGNITTTTINVPANGTNDIRGSKDCLGLIYWRT